MHVWFVIASSLLEEVKFIDKLMLLNPSDQLCMLVYEEYYDGLPLHFELVKQYELDDDNLTHLQLSPRAHLHPHDYECCDSCYRSLAFDHQERRMTTNH